MAKNYQAIGFDYGGVLKGEPTSLFLKNVCELLNITPEQYIEHYYKFNKPVQRGDRTWEELWELFVTDIGQPDKRDQVITLFKESEPKQLNQDMLALARRLKKHGYAIGLLSNHTKSMAETMRQEGLETLFDCFHVSAETGYVKPEPEAFTHLAECLAVPIDSLIFIDDSKKSLSTAAQVGYEPILFTGYDALIQRLSELGIETT